MHFSSHIQRKKSFLCANDLAVTELTIEEFRMQQTVLHPVSKPFNFLAKFKCYAALNICRPKLSHGEMDYRPLCKSEMKHMNSLEIFSISLIIVISIAIFCLPFCQFCSIALYLKPRR